MARRIPAAQETAYHREDGREELEGPAVPRRRRIRVRRPEEMHGLTVTMLVPNEYLPHLLEAYIKGAKEGLVSRRGRKLPEAVMIRQVLVEGLAQLTGEDVETVEETLAAAETKEAASVAEHQARHAA